MAELVQVNISITAEDAKLLDKMMVEDAFDNRSAFIRRMIRLEYQKRQAQLEAQVVNEPRGS